MFLQLTMVERLMALAEKKTQWDIGMLFLTAYIFLLRVPSEGLPLCVGGSAGDGTTVAATAAQGGC